MTDERFAHLANDLLYHIAAHPYLVRLEPVVLVVAVLVRRHLRPTVHVLVPCLRMKLERSICTLWLPVLLQHFAVATPQRLLQSTDVL